MVRTLLIWLLALALPAQGVIAATMVFCGAGHHGSDSAVAMSHEAAAVHQSHDHAEHAHDVIAEAHAENKASDEGLTTDKFAQSSMQKCSVCAACCSAAAIHDMVAKVPMPEAVAADFADVVPAVEPFAADGPDRPPRHVLA